MLLPVKEHRDWQPTTRSQKREMRQNPHHSFRTNQPPYTLISDFQSSNDETVHPCCSNQRSPTFRAPGTGFMEDNFPMVGVGRGGDGFGIIQVHCIIVYFISSIIASAPPQAIDHQALDSRGLSLLVWALHYCRLSNLTQGVLHP